MVISLSLTTSTRWNSTALILNFWDEKDKGSIHVKWKVLPMMSTIYLLHMASCSYRQKKHQGMNQKEWRRLDNLSCGFHITIKLILNFCTLVRLSLSLSLSLVGNMKGQETSHSFDTQCSRELDRINFSHILPNSLCLPVSYMQANKAALWMWSATQMNVLWSSAPDLEPESATFGLLC